MTFINKILITINGGNGGNGCLNFLRFKNKKILNGGNGGHGGNIIFIIDDKIKDFYYFTIYKKLLAQNGENGKKNNNNGKNGKNLYLKIPLGTKITNIITKKSIIFNKKNKKFIIAKGGIGGKGNIHINNKYYKNFDYLGKKGQKLILLLEIIILQLDIVVIGLPNVGKSTFLTKISNINTKISNYPFTTLVPIIGTINNNNNNNIIVLDFPAIVFDQKNINKNIKKKFFKYLIKAKLIIHIIDINNCCINNVFFTLQKLKKNNIYLINKHFWLIFNKIDLISNKLQKNILNKFIKFFRNFYKKYFIFTQNNNFLINKIINNLLLYFNKKK